MKFDGKAFVAFWRSWADDPNLILRHEQDAWERSGNPFWVWMAMETCGDHQREFPDWVRDYLVTAARRMMSPEIVEQNDLRGVLPRVLGFPQQRGRGKSPLQALGDGAYDGLAWAFALEISKGSKPRTALVDALNSLSPRLAAPLEDKDDKTLLRGLAKYFHLKKVPRTQPEWHQEILGFVRKEFGPLLKKYLGK